ncbi:MAG: NADH-quinone oxidoreductase subunit J [Planctomycetota bacterium]
MIEQLLFWVFAILTCGGAIAVVATQNVVRMAFWLVVSLGSVAALFFLLHADFLGAAQLLIYVGGTVVLLVFGVMLTASGPTVQIKTSPAEAFLGAGVGLLLLFVLMFSIKSVAWGDLESQLPARRLSPAVADSLQARTSEFDVSGAEDPASKAKADDAAAALVARNQAGRTVRQLGLSFFGLRPDQDLNRPAGGALAPGFLLPFEIVSIHLLVVLVGAAYLARAKRKVVPGSPTEL